MPATRKEGNGEWESPINTNRPALHNRQGVTISCQEVTYLKTNTRQSPQGRGGRSMSNRIHLSV